jgi:hypothetical protein
MPNCLYSIEPALAETIKPHTKAHWEAPELDPFFIKDNTSLTPEQKLWIYVLHHAILYHYGRAHSLGGTNYNPKDAREEATWWLFYDPRDEGDVGSFLWICKVLNIDADNVLRRCKDKDKKRIRRTCNNLEKWYA